MVYHYHIPHHGIGIGNTINMIKQINTLLANFRLQLQKDLVFVLLYYHFPMEESSELFENAHSEKDFERSDISSAAMFNLKLIFVLRLLGTHTTRTSTFSL